MHKKPKCKNLSVSKILHETTVKNHLIYLPLKQNAEKYQFYFIKNTNYLSDEPLHNHYIK